MFDDRTDAGQQLAQALEHHKDKNALVLAIPRGGVEVGYQVARHLNADLSLVISRKLPFPDNPESGFGAITEDGSTFIYEHAAYWLSPEIVESIKQQQQEEIKRRIEVLRDGKLLPEIKDRIVILVDDGIAMGSTMRASIQLCNNQKAGNIIVAAPVTGEDTAREIGKLVDEIVVLEKPYNFRAVAQVYRNWYDVPDEEVLDILQKWQSER